MTILFFIRKTEHHYRLHIASTNDLGQLLDQQPRRGLCRARLDPATWAIVGRLPDDAPVKWCKNCKREAFVRGRLPRAARRPFDPQEAADMLDQNDAALDRMVDDLIQQIGPADLGIDDYEENETEDKN